jgi:hypothetical protein
MARRWSTAQVGLVLPDLPAAQNRRCASMVAAGAAPVAIRHRRAAKAGRFDAWLDRLGAALQRIRTPDDRCP